VDSHRRRVRTSADAGIRLHDGFQRFVSRAESVARQIRAGGLGLRRRAKDAIGERRGRQLVYHRMAPVLEGSFAASKASVPCPRHGCEAVIVLKDGRVADVRYHPSPPSGGGCEHCEEIFQSCLP